MNTTVKIEGIVPLEVRQQALDWINILLSNIPFLVTICVVLGSAVVTYLINRRAIDNQNKQSSASREADHENKISEFRHNWLQEVRNTASELIKSIHESQSHLVHSNLSRDYREDARRRRDDADFDRHQSRTLDHYHKNNESIADFYFYSSKIKLLFKNGDEQTTELFKAIDEVRGKMNDTESRALDNAVIDRIISELQIVLKNEWEVTKKRSWREKT